ncbi:hypothetical protein SM114_12745 [Erwinia pyrifoliae]|uniref:hypothetical protein n=1 Tax=Erwinia pyrifoliae TaxID=79967 RepID=UPI0002DE4523
MLGLQDEYIPLDSFEGEKGFFYNKKTGQVIELSLGKELEDFQAGNINPQWDNFNDFIEWFFNI